MTPVRDSLHPDPSAGLFLTTDTHLGASRSLIQFTETQHDKEKLEVLKHIKKD